MKTEYMQALHRNLCATHPSSAVVNRGPASADVLHQVHTGISCMLCQCVFSSWLCVTCADQCIAKILKQAMQQTSTSGPIACQAWLATACAQILLAGLSFDWYMQGVYEPHHDIHMQPYPDGDAGQAYSNQGYSSSSLPAQQTSSVNGRRICYPSIGLSLLQADEQSISDNRLTQIMEIAPCSRIVLSIAYSVSKCVAVAYGEL